MKVFKSTLSTIISLAIILTGTFTVAAYDTSTNLIESFDLSSLADVDIDDIPAGVTPLIFDSEEELVQYLTVNCQPIDYHDNVNLPNNTVIITDNIAKTTKSFELRSDLTSQNESTLPRSANGYSTGNNIGSCTTSSTISAGNKTFRSSASGSLETYIILEGIGKMFERPFSISHEYTVY